MSLPPSPPTCFVLQGGARTQNIFEKDQTYRLWFERDRCESPGAWPNEFLHSGEVWLAGGRGLCYDLCFFLSKSTVLSCKLLQSVWSAASESHGGEAAASSLVRPGRRPFG